MWKLWRDWPSDSDETMDSGPSESSEWQAPESHPTVSSRTSHGGKEGFESHSVMEVQSFEPYGVVLTYDGTMESILDCVIYFLSGQ